MPNKIHQPSNGAAGEALGAFLLRAVAGSGTVQLGGMVVTFLVGVILARFLGVDGYGYYGIAMAIIALASVPGEFGLPQLVTREVAAASAHDNAPRVHGALRWANRTSLQFAVLASGLVAIIALFLPNQASGPLGPAILIGAAIIPIVALTKIRGAALQGLHFVTLGQLPAALLRPLFFGVLLLIFYMLTPKGTASQAVALNAVASLAALIAAHALLRTRLPNDGKTRPDVAGREWLASAFPMALTEGMRALQAQLSILLVGIMAPPTEAGLFRVAVSTVGMIAVPITLINTVAAPVLSRLYAQGDTARLRHLCRRSAQVMTAGVALLILPVALLGSPLLAFLFGSDFGPAFPALMVMAVGQLISAIFGPNAMLLNMTGNERRVTRAMLVALVTNTLLVVLLVPKMGHAGAAWAMAAAVVAWNVIAWWDSRQLLGVDTSMLQIGMPNVGRKEDA